MTEIRSDVKMIEALIDGKALTMAGGRRLLSFPMVEIHESNDEFWSYWRDEVSRRKAGQHGEVTPADMLFRETAFSFVATNPDSHPAWLYLTYHKDPSTAPRGVYVEGGMWFSYVMIVHNVAEGPKRYNGSIGEFMFAYEGKKTGEYEARCISYCLVGDAQAVIPGVKYQDSPTWKKIELQVGEATLRAMLFARMNLERHRYRITVTPKTKPGKKLPIGRRRLLAEDAAPHVILLNRFPDSDTEVSDAVRFGGGGSGGGTHIGRRSAYRKTLSNERFKHHEKYLVYKGVYVRDAWVGPKEANTVGNVYKLKDDD